MLSAAKTVDIEIQRDYLYKIRLPECENILKDIRKDILIFEDLDPYSCKVPSSTKELQSEALKWKGQTHYISTTGDSSGKGDFEFFSDVLSKAETIFTALWHYEKFVINKKKYNIYIDVYDIDKEDILKTEVLTNCKVLKVSKSSYDKGSSEIVKLTVNIAWNGSKTI